MNEHARASSGDDRRSGAAALSRLWHGALALIILAALVTQLVLVVNGDADADPGPGGVTVSLATRLIRLFSYFTIESNLFVLVVALTLAVRPDRDGPRWRIAHLDALLGIIITGLVYAIVLAPETHLTGAALWANTGFHYVAPPAALVGWLVFGPRPRITWRGIVGAFVWPVLWIAYTFAHGAATGWYPYPFLDVATKGYPTALVNTAAVVVIALVLAAVLKLIDRLPDLQRRRPVPSVVD